MEMVLDSIFNSMFEEPSVNTEWYLPVNSGMKTDWFMLSLQGKVTVEPQENLALLK